MKISEIRPNIYYAKFDTQYNASITLIRFQEFYESPYKNIQAKYFTLEEYMDTWAKEHGHFTYTSTYNGYNFSSYIVNRWIDNFTGEMRQKEIDFLKELFKINKGNKLYYVIGGANNNIIIHELAHAYYYLNGNYQAEMLNLLDCLPKNLINKSIKSLIKQGYDKSVINDELQAYFVDSIKWNEDLLGNSVLSYKDRNLLKPFYEVFQNYDKAYKKAHKRKTESIHL